MARARIRVAFHDHIPRNSVGISESGQNSPTAERTRSVAALWGDHDPHGCQSKTPASGDLTTGPMLMTRSARNLPNDTQTSQRRQHEYQRAILQST